jgi:hypothetical protein
MLACVRGNIEIIRFLISRNVDVDVVLDDEVIIISTLHFVSYLHFYYSVEQSVKFRETNLATTIIALNSENRVHVLRILVEYGVDLHAKTVSVSISLILRSSTSHR